MTDSCDLSQFGTEQLLRHYTSAEGTIQGRIQIRAELVRRGALRERKVDRREQRVCDCGYKLGDETGHESWCTVQP